MLGCSVGVGGRGRRGRGEGVGWLAVATTTAVSKVVTQGRARKQVKAARAAAARAIISGRFPSLIWWMEATAAAADRPTDQSAGPFGPRVADDDANPSCRIPHQQACQMHNAWGMPGSRSDKPLASMHWPPAARFAPKSGLPEHANAEACDKKRKKQVCVCRDGSSCGPVTARRSVGPRLLMWIH
jgi:hypothetical protein